MEFIDKDTIKANKPLLKAYDILPFLKYQVKVIGSPGMNKPQSSSKPANSARGNIWGFRREESSIPNTNGFAKIAKQSKSLRTLKTEKKAEEPESFSFFKDEIGIQFSMFSSKKLRLPIPNFQIPTDSEDSEQATARKQSTSKSKRRNLSIPVLGNVVTVPPPPTERTPEKLKSERHCYSSRMLLKPIGKLWKSKGINIDEVPVSHQVSEQSIQIKRQKPPKPKPRSTAMLRRRFSQIDLISLCVFNEYHDSSCHN
ncbi:unnamed protein product [Blepharisma stoltei]|uniref:Uncharacterized protein n=1 Tax=Blepharisma stoltei TaxID=1481888 RepID=A0AAU9IPV0_9CILI|nr:unnamed protein product [Blepharisma stoltei]